MQARAAIRALFMRRILAGAPSPGDQEGAGLAAAGAGFGPLVERDLHQAAGRELLDQGLQQAAVEIARVGRGANHRARAFAGLNEGVVADVAAAGAASSRRCRAPAGRPPASGCRAGSCPAGRSAGRSAAPVLGPTSSIMVLKELRKSWCEYQRSARGSTMPFLASTRSATVWKAPITFTIDSTTLPETSVAGLVW